MKYIENTYTLVYTKEDVNDLFDALKRLNNMGMKKEGYSRESCLSMVEKDRSPGNGLSLHFNNRGLTWANEGYAKREGYTFIPLSTIINYKKQLYYEIY